MSGTSSIPQPSWSDAGLTNIPTEAEILAGVLADFNAAFGGYLNTVNLEFPEGQLASSHTASIAYLYAQLAAMPGRINPATSGGIWQDGIARLYFIERIPATATVVTVTCTGSAEVYIPAGALVQDIAGNRYASTAPATISAGGTVDVAFQALQTGPIDCPPAAITTIYRAIPGWDAVTNSAAGIAGRNVEGRADFEARRRASVAKNAVNSLASIRAAVLEVPGVLSAYVVENFTGSTVTVGGVSLLAHSIYVAVVGGDSTAVANAIWRKAPPGCNMNGSTTITVRDTAYPYPQPSYGIKFTIAAPIAIKFAVEIDDLPTNVADIVAQIKNVILTAFNGGYNNQRETTGKTISAGSYYPFLLNNVPSIQIRSILVGTTTADQHSIAPNIDKVPTLAIADITVTPI